jgi:hypothetical protein
MEDKKENGKANFKKQATTGADNEHLSVGPNGEVVTSAQIAAQIKSQRTGIGATENDEKQKELEQIKESRLVHLYPPEEGRDRANQNFRLPLHTIVTILRLAATLSQKNYKTTKSEIIIRAVKSLETEFLARGIELAPFTEDMIEDVRTVEARIIRGIAKSKKKRALATQTPELAAAIIEADHKDFFQSFRS